MQKTWNWKSATRALAAGILCFIAAVMLMEMWGAWTTPEDYPFGAEGPAAAMWSYRSQTNYLLACFTLWLASVLAVWALLTAHGRTWLRWLCGLAILMVWALMALDGTRLDP
ncbi:hypothetical protein SAMN05216345_11410 [Cupriavidus sp. YR651]|uniref:hypothetical protein n=1 Tax=Cupriavidus sp. YR651 TaxID=1855315 RepID=UPI00088967F3|nr:hypothetical protein [Cupriavidus sp. YR651]SDD70995.1 hypothetical protein SAMN05216345_11410 [Cupriavidus sp. YR651]